MLRQPPSSNTPSPAEISISSKYLSAIPRFLQQQYPDLELGQIVHRRKSTPLIPQPEISTGSRFFQPSLSVTIKRCPARFALKIPSRAPLHFSMAGSTH